MIISWCEWILWIGSTWLSHDVNAKISDRKVIHVSRSLGQSTAKIKIISFITQWNASILLERPKEIFPKLTIHYYEAYLDWESTLSRTKLQYWVGHSVEMVNTAGCKVSSASNNLLQLQFLPFCTNLVCWVGNIFNWLRLGHRPRFRILRWVQISPISVRLRCIERALSKLSQFQRHL